RDPDALMVRLCDSDMLTRLKPVFCNDRSNGDVNSVSSSIALDQNAELNIVASAHCLLPQKELERQDLNLHRVFTRTLSRCCSPVSHAPILIPEDGKRISTPNGI